MAHLVSILVPAYNAARWIRECIQSAVAQHWPRKEIIVVDDGSQDATLEIARSFCSKNVEVVTQQNRGASAARNVALSLAQGDYIQWLDADDVLEPQKIGRQMESVDARADSSTLISGSWGRFYARREKTRFVASPLWQDLTPQEWLFTKIDGNFWMAIESWLVSRALTDAAGPWNEDLSLDDDGEYFCRVVARSTAVRFVPGARCCCRSGSVGISHALTLDDRKLDSQWKSLVTHMETLRRMEDSERTRSACLRLLERWSVYFYPERIDIWEQMKYLSAELGGSLSIPELRRKYRWVQRLFGWTIGKAVQRWIPTLRSLTLQAWERFPRP